jgi:hypothetical protein
MACFVKAVQVSSWLWVGLFMLVLSSQCSFQVVLCSWRASSGPEANGIKATRFLRNPLYRSSFDIFFGLFWGEVGPA